MELKNFEENEDLPSDKVNVFLYTRRLNYIGQGLRNEVNVHHWGVFVEFPAFGYAIDAGKTPYPRISTFTSF